MNKKLEQYFTPKRAVEKLLSEIPFPFTGTIFEPCAGEGAISNTVKDFYSSSNIRIITNDIDPSLNTDYCRDISKIESWMDLPEIDWIITNPPFSLADKILPLCLEHSKKGLIALVRLSFLEPCRNRKVFLSNSPPDSIWVTNRISFDGNGTDNVTTCWLFWTKQDMVKKILPSYRPFLKS